MRGLVDVGPRVVRFEDLGELARGIVTLRCPLGAVAVLDGSLRAAVLKRAVVTVPGCALELGGICLHLGELEPGTKRPVGEHQGIAPLTMKQVLEHAVRSGESYE
jgi:hypothetical protein